MIEFLDGPAAGQQLCLRRDPLFLRVVFNPRGRSEQWDALDLQEDEPKPHERVFAYKRVERFPPMHVKATKRSQSGWHANAKYRLCDPQPVTEEILRYAKVWQTWCRERLNDPTPADSHPDRPLLVAAILADPHDDTPRLAFADWLQENDDPEYAEFIRVQCKLERIAPSLRWLDDKEECFECYQARHGRQHTNAGCKCSPRVRELRKRESDLLTQECSTVPAYQMPRPRPRWVGWKTPKSGFHADLRWRFRRGFVHEIRLSADHWWNAAALLTSRHPIWEVELTTWPEDAVYAALMRSGWIGNRRADWADALGLRWRGIRFTMPRDEETQPELGGEEG